MSGAGADTEKVESRSEQLRRWYLAGLRKQVVAASQCLTPGALMDADRQFIDDLILSESPGPFPGQKAGGLQLVVLGLWIYLVLLPAIWAYVALALLTGAGADQAACASVLKSGLLWTVLSGTHCLRRLQKPHR